MNITSKAHVIFGIPATPDMLEKFYTFSVPDSVTIQAFGVDSDNPVIGFPVRSCTTFYSFADITPLQLITREQEESVAQFLTQISQEKPSYYLMAECT